MSSEPEFEDPTVFQTPLPLFLESEFMQDSPKKSKRNIDQLEFDENGQPVKKIKYHDTHICKPCGEEFKSKFNLDRHVKNIHHKERFFCELCDSSFSQKHSLKGHIRSKHDKIKIPCAYCTGMFAHKLSLQRHLATQHGIKDNSKPQYMCYICQQEFKSKLQLRVHLRKHRYAGDEASQSIGDFSCSFCLQHFSDREEYLIHMEICENIAGGSDNVELQEPVVENEVFDDQDQTSTTKREIFLDQNVVSDALNACLNETSINENEATKVHKPVKKSMVSEYHFKLNSFNHVLFY